MPLPTATATRVLVLRCRARLADRRRRRARLALGLRRFVNEGAFTVTVTLTLMSLLLLLLFFFFFPAFCFVASICTARGSAGSAGGRLCVVESRAAAAVVAISLLLAVFIVKVLDRAHQVPPAVERQCRPRTSGVENLDCDPRRQCQILQSNADLGQAFATLESFAVFGTRVSNRISNVDTVILEQPFDDREVAAMSSHSHGVVFVGRRIDALILQ
jgi:hypothetical protein